MKQVKIILFGIIVVLGMSMFTGCALGVVATYPSGRVIVAPGPPPFIGAIWIAGEYHWVNGQYVEVGGYWAHPRHGRAWVPGRWVPVRGGYAWQRGHWR